MEKEPLLDSKSGDDSDGSQREYLSDEEEINAIVNDYGDNKGLTCRLVLAIVSCILGASFMYGYNTGVLNSPETGLTSRLVLAITTCILGSSFMVGYNIGVLNTPEIVIQDFYNNSHHDRTGDYMSDSTMTLIWGITISIYCVGGMIGGMSAGYLSNRFGRKGIMLRNGVITIIAGALLFFSKMANSYEMLIAGRFIAGIAAGIYTGAAPLYLSEIAPIKLRGFAGTFNQLAIVLGILISNILGLNTVLGSDDLWQYVVGFTVLPAIFQLITLPCCPETPRYYMLFKNDEEEAEKALIWFRGNVDVSDEIEEMRSEGEMQQGSEEFKLTDLFKKKELLTPLIISVMMQLSQQLSGINAVIYYSTSIFEAANLSHQNAQYATLGTSAVNVAMTLVSAFIVDRAGRRTLHLCGLGGLFIFSLILSISQILQSSYPWLTYVCIVAVVLYIVSFAIGPGSIPWFIVAELFSQSPRSAAMSIAVLVNWSANFTVGIVFPELQSNIGAYSFIPFVVLLALFWIFTFIKLPETKGKTIEQITAMFVNDSSVQYERLVNDST